jgi:hypothetical protein
MNSETLAAACSAARRAALLRRCRTNFLPDAYLPLLTDRVEVRPICQMEIRR